MADAFSPTSITSPIQQLLDERQGHLDAISAIDKKLEQIGSILRSGGRAAAGHTNGKTARAAHAPKPVGRPAKKRGGRRSFAISGEESVLAFIKEHKNPTTHDIEAHWQSEGRGATAANTLSRLGKDGKVKRTPLGKGIRGSRYTLA